MAGVTGSSHPASGELCRKYEVPRWRWPGRGGAGPPGEGAAGRRGDDRGRGRRPGDSEAVPGLADEREPVAAGAGGRRPGGAGLQGGGRGEVQADRGAGRRAGRSAGCRAGGRGLPGSVLDAGAGRGQAWRRFGVEYTLAGTAVLLHRIGWTVQVPARRAAERDEDKIARWREDTWPVIKARRPRDLGAWLRLEAVRPAPRPPKGRTWGARYPRRVTGPDRVSLPGPRSLRSGHRAARLIDRNRLPPG